jgi:putative transcriptional regulator
VIHWIDFLIHWMRSAEMQRKTHRDTRSKNLAKALETIQEARRGNRTYEAKPIDVVALRGRMGMSQELFARRFGFPVATLRHWERGDRKPRGTARVLLQVIAHNPRAVLQALR